MSVALEPQHRLCRAPGVELIGQVEGSGLTEPPYLVRRSDGQTVQLTRLLFALLEQAEPNRDLAVVGQRAGEELDVRIAPEQVRHVLDRKLAPLGLAVDSKGFVAEPPPVEDVMALRMRVGLVPPRSARWPRCSATCSTRRSSRSCSPRCSRATCCCSSTAASAPG